MLGSWCHPNTVDCFMVRRSEKDWVEYTIGQISVTREAGEGKVSEASVENAFTNIRRAVKDRPEDTVVVFLAGHTDVLRDQAGHERFSLLLPSFPFPANAPMLADVRGHR